MQYISKWKVKVLWGSLNMCDAQFPAAPFICDYSNFILDQKTLWVENVNYPNPCCDWTDSCWSKVDCQGGAVPIIYWCSSFFIQTVLPHQDVFFTSLGPDVLICVCQWKREKYSNNDLSNIFVALRKSFFLMDISQIEVKHLVLVVASSWL